MIQLNEVRKEEGEQTAGLDSDGKPEKINDHSCRNLVELLQADNNSRLVQAEGPHRAL
jgi:hypothetical protein